MLPVDFLLMVNNIRGRILLIVCYMKIAISEGDAKKAVYPFKVIIQG